MSNVDYQNKVLFFSFFFYLSTEIHTGLFILQGCVLNVGQLREKNIESDRIPEEQNQGRFVKALSVIGTEHVRFHFLQFTECTQVCGDAQNVQQSVLP